MSVDKLESASGAMLKWESPAPPDQSKAEEEKKAGEIFPHLYGVGLDMSLVDQVVVVHRNSQGCYDFNLSA
jgi:uncharacterized protein (DUF952 family)